MKRVCNTPQEILLLGTALVVLMILKKVDDVGTLLQMLVFSFYLILITLVLIYNTMLKTLKINCGKDGDD